MNETIKNEKVNFIFNFIIFTLMLFSFFETRAATFNAKVSVTVLQQTCDIFSSANPNQPISIDFGDVAAGKIDGTMYQKEIPFSVNCTNGANNPALKLRMTGDAGFIPVVLGTSKNGLGILFRFGNDPLSLGSWANFNYSSRPKLTATPFASNPKTLTGGTFTAASILVVEYQ